MNYDPNKELLLESFYDSRGYRLMLWQELTRIHYKITRNSRIPKNIIWNVMFLGRQRELLLKDAWDLSERPNILRISVKILCMSWYREETSQNCFPPIAILLPIHTNTHMYIPIHPSTHIYTLSVCLFIPFLKKQKKKNTREVKNCRLLLPVLNLMSWSEFQKGEYLSVLSCLSNHPSINHLLK